MGGGITLFLFFISADNALITFWMAVNHIVKENEGENKKQLLDLLLKNGNVNALRLLEAFVAHIIKQ